MTPQEQSQLNKLRNQLNQFKAADPSPIGTMNRQNNLTVPVFIVATITAKAPSDPNQYEWQEVVRTQMTSSSSSGGGYEHLATHRAGTVANGGFCYDLAPFGNAVQVGDHVVLMRSGFKVASSSSGGGQYATTWLIIGKENLEYVGWVNATSTGGAAYPPSWTYSLYADAARTVKIADNVAVWRAAPTRVLNVYATAASNGSKVKYWWDTSGGSPVPVITQIQETIVTQICDADT